MLTMTQYINSDLQQEKDIELLKSVVGGDHSRKWFPKASLCIDLDVNLGHGTPLIFSRVSMM